MCWSCVYVVTVVVLQDAMSRLCDRAVASRVSITTIVMGLMIFGYMGQDWTNPHYRAPWVFVIDVCCVGIGPFTCWVARARENRFARAWYYPLIEIFWCYVTMILMLVLMLGTGMMWI